VRLRRSCKEKTKGKKIGIEHQRSEENVGGINEDEIKSSFLGNPKVKIQQGRNKSPFWLKGEKLR